MTRPKRKRLIIIISLIIVLILLIPLPQFFSDGGTVTYSAIVYTISDVNALWHEDGHDGYLVGLVITVFGIRVYDNLRFEKHD